MFKKAIISTFLLFCSFAHSSELIDYAHSVAIRELRSNEVVPLKKLAAIPPDLQNLPYAIYPTDHEYNTQRFNYNKRFNIFPKAIICPRTFEEAQFVLTALKSNNLEFAIRSGGHCFESGSLSSEYIFDLRNFNTIVPDVPNEEVYIGAGCLLNNVIQTLGNIDYAIPTGTCPTVCVTGLTLGGGIGLLTRTFGLTCDSVKSITFLNANSEIIEVNDNSYPDLFWALKGGGNGSYGIVLGFTFTMHAVPEVSFFELKWDWKPNHTARIINTWQKWAQTLPSSINTSIRLEYKEGDIKIRIIGIKVGSEPFTEWITAFQKYNPTVSITQGRYIDTVPLWSSEPTLPFNKSKSKICFKPVSKEVIRDIIDYLEYLNVKRPNLRIFLNFDAFGGNVPNFDNSFDFRHAFGWWYQAVYWPLQTQDREAEHLINRIYKQTSHKISKHSYANATDYDLGGTYLKAYYGSYVDRLIAIKNMYDPENLFRWHQSIPLARPSSSSSFCPSEEGQN